MAKTKTLGLFFVSCILAPLTFAQNLELGATSGLAALSGFPSLQRSQVELIQAHIESAIQSDLSVVEALLHQQNTCREFVRVDFHQIGDSRPEVIDFEQSLFKIESMTCLSSTESGRVIDVLRSFEFQKAAFETLRGFDQKGLTTCHSTQVMGLGRSDYCYKDTLSENQSEALLRSSLSQVGAASTTPLYLRESADLILQQKSGTAVYSVAYVRGATLNSMLKFFAKNKVQSSQQLFSRALKSFAR